MHSAKLPAAPSTRGCTPRCSSTAPRRTRSASGQSSRRALRPAAARGVARVARLALLQPNPRAGFCALLLTRALLLQLAEIGYTTYTRVNALWLDPDDCANATKANCQQGLTLAHAKAWARIAQAPDDGALGYLVLEDDVTFHTHFRKLFPRYAAEARGSASFSSAQVPALTRSPSAARGLHRRIRGPAEPGCAGPRPRVQAAEDAGAVRRCAVHHARLPG